MKAIYCRNCGKPIRFIEMPNGRTMPVDEKHLYVMPNTRGKMTIITQAGQTIKGNPCSPSQTGAVRGFSCHWPNCGKNKKPPKKITQAEFRRQRAQTVSHIRIPTCGNHPHTGTESGAGRNDNEAEEQLKLF